MKKLALPLAFTLLLPLSAVAQSPSKNIHEQADPYTNLRTLYLEVPTSRCSDDPPLREHDPQVHLLFSASENKDHTVSYFLTSELDHGDVLNIRTRGTMDTLIDGRVGSLTTPLGSTVTTAYDGNNSYLHETIPYRITQDDLAQLASAGMFQFRVNGLRQDVQRCVDARHLRDLPEYLQAASQYGPPAALAPIAAPRASRRESVPSSPSTTIRSHAIETYACPGDARLGPHDPTVLLTLDAEQRSDHTVRYFLDTDLTGSEVLNLRNRGTLVTLIGGVTQHFHNPHGSSIENITGPDGKPLVHETIAFHMDRRNLIALSKTPVLEFRIEGAQKSVQRCTDAANLQDAVAFLNTTAALYDHPVALANTSAPR